MKEAYREGRKRTKFYRQNETEGESGGREGKRGSRIEIARDDESR